ncbi:hypothetical protein [Siccirubricoccus phaeus]|uniref:hypothetical protein n=1 Tax=Siccirubricoccus phaeus TaxID=2595053 RepID=UPI0011F24BFD|nr:hypothetical protein [Siccirubricoccus phaeus]
MAGGILSALRTQANELGDGAESYGRRARREFRDRGREFRSRGDETRTELARLWSQLEDLVERRVVPTASEAVGNARDYAREGRDAAVYVAGHLREATRAQPLLAIGIAVTATWLISSMLRGRR